MTDYHALHCEAHAWALKNAAEEQNAALRARVAELEGRLARSCEWTEDDEGNWETACGNFFCFIDGGPVENEAKFCCYCGGNLLAVEYEGEGSNAE